MTAYTSKKIIQEAFSFLNQFTNYERALRYPYNGWAMNLTRVQILLSALGSPEQKLKAIHIAGTKGKGSTSKMIQSILSAQGFKVGLYTSPHLVKINERVTINGKMITDLELARRVLELREAVELVRKKPELGEVTYFELLTASAFAHFAREKVDFAVLETGLGGRFDATNVCHPVLVVLTPISYDHTDILGKTLSAIAREKAMIIKPKTKVIISVQPEPAKKIFLQRVREVQAQLFPLENYYQWKLSAIKPKEMIFDLLGKRILKNLKTKMVGPQQMSNAGCAVLAMDLLEGLTGKISDSAIRQGLQNARLAGRFQQVEFWGRKLILDGAHNQESAKALRETLGLVYPGKPINLVAGLSQDKDLEGFFAELKPLAKKIFISQAKIQRAAPREKMESALQDFSGEIIFEPNLRRAMRRILRTRGKDELVVITGSFYLVGEAIEWLKEQKIKIQIP